MPAAKGRESRDSKNAADELSTGKTVDDARFVVSGIRAECTFAAHDDSGRRLGRAPFKLVW